MLLAWSTLFRSRDTFSNYLSYVKTACLCVHAPVQASASHLRVMAPMTCPPSQYCVQVFENPGLKKAKLMIANAGQFTRRKRMWVQL